MTKSKKRDLDGLEPTGDLPYLLTLEADEKHTITVELDDFGKHKDGGPKEKWSCYRCTIDGNENTEVPFYMMEPFYDAIKDAYKAGDDEIELIYKRKIKGDKNIATFQEA